MEDAFEEREVAGVVWIGVTALFAIHLENAPRRPCVDGRVHVAKRPFVSGQLTIRVHVPLAREQCELRLGELRVHERKRDAVERQVPRGIPRVFPFVGHGNNVGVVDMLPLMVATVLAFAGRRELAGVAFDPLADVVIKKLFRPNHSGESLPLDITRIGISVVRLELRVKFIGLAQTCGEDAVEIGERLRARGFTQAQSNTRRTACRNRQLVERAGFRAGAFGIHSGLISVNNVFVKSVLEKPLGVPLTVEASGVRFILAEQ